MKIIFPRDPRLGGPTLDMTPDGQFRAPPPTPWATKLLRYAIVVAVLAGAFAVAALVLWAALIMIPIAIGAALVAYGAFRWKMWKARRHGYDVARRPGGFGQ